MVETLEETLDISYVLVTPQDKTLNISGVLQIQPRETLDISYVLLIQAEKTLNIIMFYCCKQGSPGLYLRLGNKNHKKPWIISLVTKPEKPCLLVMYCQKNLSKPYK